MKRRLIYSPLFLSRYPIKMRNLLLLICLVGLASAKLSSSGSSSGKDDNTKVLDYDFKELEKEEESMLEEMRQEMEDGSGDDDNDDEDDDENYDDDDEYDYDEDDYDEDDYESSGAMGQWDEDDDEEKEDGELEKITEDKDESIDLDDEELDSPSKKSDPESDIHFEEDLADTKESDDDLLSEYYDEEYEPDYYENEDYKKDWVIKEEIRPEIHATGIPTRPLGGDSSDTSLDSLFAKFFHQFKLSYVYIMLASAFVSFALCLAMFFLCRRSALERERMNAKLVPFVVSDPRNHRPSPIVKNYQRVPTSTKEFMVRGEETRVVEMPSQHGPNKPLLT